MCLCFVVYCVVCCVGCYGYVEVVNVCVDFDFVEFVVECGF